MIVVHHLDNSRSRRVIWLLEELGAEYRIEPYRRHPESRSAPEALKSIDRLGKSPIIKDGAVTLAESGLIVEYLCDRFPERGLAPPKRVGVDDAARLRFLYWLHYAEGSAMAPLLLRLLIGGINDPSVAALKSGFITRELNAHADFWNAELTDSAWFCGDAFSAADVMMAFPIEMADRFGYLETRPALGRFLQSVRSRPAYALAEERARMP